MRDYEPTVTTGVVEEVLPHGLYRVVLDGEARVCHKGSMLRRVGATIEQHDRVSVLTEADGVFRGEITQVRPPLAGKSAPPPPRAGLISPGGSEVLRPADQRVDRTAHPGWPTAAEREPNAGDAVYCTAGTAVIVRVLGKTGNGSRLLELRLSEETRTSFFAAASNVLLAPVEAAAAEAAPAGQEWRAGTPLIG